MGSFQLPPDAPPPQGALGTEVARWMREADGRLVALSAAEASPPRADDFGHVTEIDPVEPAPHAVTTRVTTRATTRASDVNARSGIVVAPGWGERPRPY